jgi:hypothetical protein
MLLVGELFLNFLAKNKEKTTTEYQLAKGSFASKYQ